MEIFCKLFDHKWIPSDGKIYGAGRLVIASCKRCSRLYIISYSTYQPYRSGK